MLKTSRSLKIVTVSLLHAVCRCGLLLHILRCSRWRTHWRHLAYTIERQCAVKMRPCAKLPLVLVNEKSSHKIHWRCYRFYDTSFESLVCRFVYDICSYMSITLNCVVKCQAAECTRLTLRCSVWCKLSLRLSRY